MKLKKILFFLLLLSFTAGLSQNTVKKLDKIIKRNYDIIECTISKMSDKEVEYSMPGESLKIVLDVSQIAKIDFASGRSQVFDINPQSNTADNSGTHSLPENGSIKTNMIAVLPAPFINTDNLQSSDAMSKIIQNDIFKKLTDKSTNIAPLTILDLRTTDALLHKAGINSETIDETPIEDLHKILGVDNIIAIKVSYTTSQSASHTTYGNINNNQKSSDKDKTTTTTTYDNNQTNYHYTVYFDMFKNGQKIYSQTRHPILSTKDSWMDSVSYLLKRSPIYVKK